MTGKFPLEYRAAAELELRRRQKERAENCPMCAFESAVVGIYKTPTAVAACSHHRDEQDPDSTFWRNVNENIQLSYGENNNVEAFI